MIKDIVIVGLLLTLAALSFGEATTPEPAIEDTRPPVVKADYMQCVQFELPPLNFNRCGVKLYPHRKDDA